MSGIVHVLFAFLSRFGGLGLLVLGFLDSSFLFAPFGADLLLIGMSAHHHARAPYYAFMVALGSVAGCAAVDLMSRKGGEKGLEKLFSRRRINSLRRRIRSGAGWALSFASLMPPPFPFTPFIVSASALQYPRRRLLTVVGIARLGRYLLEALLAIYFGEQLLQVAHSSLFEIAIVILIGLSIFGSIISAYRWFHRRK